MRGLVIVFEGPEGVGKTTHVRLLAERLERAGVSCLTLREPGGTALGDQVRQLVLGPEHDVGVAAEALLFMASRAELVERVIRPALEGGRVVLLDRFFLSTYAYQVAGRGLPEDEVRAANHLATGGLVPDLTLLISKSAAAGQRRVARRGERDRMERTGDAFHRRVAEAFERFLEPAWQRAHPECGPIVGIDGRGSVAEVSGRVASILATRFPETFAALAESHQ